MSRAHRALRAFEAKIRLADGSPRWPHLNFHENPPQIVKDFWYAPRVLKFYANRSIDFLCDNRVVAIQGNEEDGEVLMLRHLALSAHMVEVPGTSRSSQPWTDGGFRFGYRFSHETKSKSEEEQFATMMESLVAMANAADKFSAWADDVQRNPVFRMRISNEPSILAAMQDASGAAAAA